MSKAFRLNAVRLILVALVLVPVLGAVAATHKSKAKPKPKPVSDIQVRHEKLKAVEDDYWEFFLRENPEYATVLGEYKYNDRLTDYSLAHVEEIRAQTAALFQRARSIDTTGLSDADRLDQLLLVRTLADRLESIRLKNHEMVIDQMNGVHLAWPQIASYAPFDSVQHYRDYIARLNAMPLAIDQVIERSRAGLKDGLMQPRYLLEKTVVQSTTLADAAGESSPFAAPLANMPASFSAAEREQLRADILAAVDGKVRPAYARLKTFLAEEYAPKGREEFGVWALPDGDARYRYAIHTQTTTSLTSDQIHEIGLAQVADLENQITALAKSAGYADRKSFEHAVFSDPKLKGTSRQQVLDRYSHFIGQMEPKLPQLFGLLPKSKLVVTSVPAYMEKESSTQYIAGTPDGSRPGQVWVVTYDYATRDMLDDEATAYHEGVPGHHMQISIAQELPGLHPFHRAVANDYNAYVEGWALYSERLGKEVGFYQDPASDLGRLRSELYRALRLVVDTGVHGKHWSRQQMVDYWNEHLPPASDAEMDRYISWPGQALGYKLGQLKILELRKRAQSELGPKFDIRAFHDEILNAGALPLDVLESRINAWIARTKNK
ncbi:MAG: hypothetical protein RL261_1241 [Pseudomonadota bacterium]